MSAALRRRLAPALLTGAVCAAGASCVEPPPRVPVAPRPDVTASLPPAPPPLPARWVESGGATLIGPEVAGGTLVLLGGRRALVRADGSLETERAAAPEPLLEIVEVPSPRGARLAGRGAHGVYRFDDPLGAPVTLARSQGPLGHLGAGPGVVAVWTDRSDLPRFLDVETGHEQKLPGLPEPPLRSLAFVDARRGAGVFEAVGLAVTTDGGASWRVAAGRGPRDALGINGVRRRGAALRAFAFADGPDAAVEIEAAHLGALEPVASTASEPAIFRWIRASARDPLEAVATGGLDLPTGGALVASHGMIARVDARTGAVTDLLELARGKWLPCSAARSGQSGWVACTLAEDAGKALFDPFGVLRVPLGEGPWKPEKPALLRNGEAELRVSPSGGVMLMAACSTDEQGQACVRQPDGTWKTINTKADLGERGAGPLADGRLAFLRGLFDGDDPPDPVADDDEGARARRLHVALVGPNGKEHALAPVSFTPSRGYVRTQSPIEEDVDRTLHFVIEDGEGPFAVVATPGREAAPAQRIPDVAAARVHAGHGIAVGEGRVLGSLDGGATWNEVAAPPPVLEAASAVAAAYDDPDRLAVSELGAKIGPMLRLGWGTPDPAPPPREAAAAGPLLAASNAGATGPERRLTCASAGPSPGTPTLLGAAQIRPLLAGKDAKAPAGARRESNVWSPGHAGMLETVALLDEEGPDKRGEPPATWTFHWYDPQELGGKVHHVGVKAPAGAAWGTSLRFAASSGGRALFAVRSGGKLRLVRLKPAGAAEIVEVPQELVPSGEVVFGAERGEAIAWGHETLVIAWLAGERPRAIAELATHATRALGTPTPEGVPLLLGAADWSLLRVLPLPAPEKTAPDKAPAPAVAALDGWTRLPPLRGALGTLPACAGRTRGARFSLGRAAMPAEIDGVEETAGAAIYALRLTGTEACVAGLTATLAPARKSGKPAAAAVKPGKAGVKAATAGAPAGFVRVDLEGKRAEGGDRGLAPEAGVRRMSCGLEEKR
jgi:hypothetical protein